MYCINLCTLIPTTSDFTYADLGPATSNVLWIQGCMVLSLDSVVNVPVRINGSAIESLFSRFKYDAGGNLSATNYESAISRLLTADAVSEGKKEESAYRKDKLSVTWIKAQI